MKSLLNYAQKYKPKTPQQIQIMEDKLQEAEIKRNN